MINVSVTLALLLFVGLTVLSTTSHAAAGSRPFLISAIHFDAELKAGKMSVLDIAPLAVKYGAQGVEYRDIYWKEKGRELFAVRDQVKRLGLVVTYTTTVTLFSNDREKQKQLLTDIEDTKALGAPLLRVNLGIRPTTEQDAAGQRDAARKAIEHAASLGVLLALENNSAPPGEKLYDIKATLEEYKSGTLGTNIDFANYATTSQDPVEAIRALAPYIIYAHAKDAKKSEGTWKTTYLGGGALPLRQIFAALDATGRSYLLCLEFPGSGDPEGGLAKSKEFLASSK